MAKRLFGFYVLIFIEALCLLYGIAIDSPSFMIAGAFGLGLSTAFIIAMTGEEQRRLRK